MAVSILYLVNNPGSLGNDTSIVNALQTAGYNVTIGDSADAEVAGGYDVVIFGRTISFAELGAKYTDTKMGIVSFNANPNLRMHSGGTNEPGCDQLDILQPNHSALGAGITTTGLTVPLLSATTTWSTVVPANWAAGVLQLGEAESTTEIALAIAERGMPSTGTKPFMGRRVMAGCFNDSTATPTTAGLNLLFALVDWAAGANPAPAVIEKTIGPGGDYATIQAWVNAGVALGNLATAQKNGVVWRGVMLAALGLSNEQVVLTDGSVRTDADCYFELIGQGPGTGINYSGTLAAGDDLTHWGAPYTKLHNFELTYSGPNAHSGGGGGSSSGCKTNSSFVLYNRLYAHDIDISTNTVGLSANACIGAVIANCMVHTINGGSDTFSEIRGIKMDPGGCAEWPSAMLNNTVWNIGNNGTSTTGIGIFALVGSTETGRCVHVKGCVAGQCKTKAFTYTNMASGTATIVTDRNVSDDDSADDNGDGTHLINQSQAALVASPSPPFDLHRPASSPLAGFGLDLTSYGPSLAVDFDGDPRTAPFDAGADQVPPAAGTSKRGRYQRRRRLAGAL